MILQVIKLLLSVFESILISVVDISFDLLSSIVKAEKDHGYSAEFGSPNDQLQRKPGGFRIGHKWGTSIEESYSHMICLGGSGSKKSSCICFNTLLQSHDCSYVVFDCSGELFNGTASYKHEVGYRILKLDYDDFEKSIGFNGLAKCKSEIDVSRICEVTINNYQEGAPNDYWKQSAVNMTSLFAFALWKHADPKHTNFLNVLNMLEVYSYAPERCDRWIISTGDTMLINRYKALNAVPEKTRLSTLATATNALSVYRSQNIAAITSHDTLSFDLFRQEKCILYLCGSPAMAKFCRGVSANFFEAFFAHVLSKAPTAGEYGITFLIDEAATMRLATLPKILELGRKRLISIATLWQDFGQVQHIFGDHEAANILANSRLKAYMPSGQPGSTCRSLQELLGRYSYKDEKGTTKTRELLTAQEIYQLSQILVLNGNNKPMLLEPLPYFSNKKLKKLTQMPLYEMPLTAKLPMPEVMEFL